MDDILARLRNALDNAYIAAGEHINAAAMTPEEHANAVAKNPEFKRAAQDWAAYVNSVRARQSSGGMLPVEKNDLQRRVNPAPGMLPRPAKPADSVPSFVRG